MTLQAKMVMSDLQQYPWNINLVNNVADIVVFLTRIVFISVIFSIASYEQEMRKSLLQRNRKCK